MAEEAERAAGLRAAFHAQTARARWSELAVHFAGGRVIRVAPALDLVEVAVQLGLDNRDRFEAWTAAGEVRPAGDDDARAWSETDAELWAVVAPPWVLVQPCEDDRDR